MEALGDALAWCSGRARACVLSAALFAGADLICLEISRAQLRQHGSEEQRRPLWHWLLPSPRSPHWALPWPVL